MNYPIYVPSRGRAGRLFTPSALPLALRQRLVLVVPYGAKAEYSQAHPDLQVLATPEQVQGIGPTRQWLLDRTIERGSRLLVMFDDDVVSIGTKATGQSLIRKADPSTWIDALAEMERAVRAGECGLCCIWDRERAWQCLEDYKDNTNILITTMLDVDLASIIGARYDRVVVYEDLDMNLQFLAQGHRTRAYTKWVINKKPEGEAGGCSLYRDDSVKLEAGEMISLLHPGIVKMVVKQRADGPYTSTRVDWRAAYGAAHRVRQETLL